jgi:hypothetical protein
MAIDWDGVRATAQDCLFATFHMAYWAERSQEVDYDNNSAAQHLAAIVKARSTFGWAMGVVNANAVSRLGREGQPSDPCAISNLGDQYSVFHLLAQASVGESARPDFGIFATAHEAAFGLLLMLLMWVENEVAYASEIVGTSDKFIVGIEDLHRCSPEELRDTLFEIEKIKPMRRVLDSTLTQSHLRAWIDREWAAVSTTDKGESEQADVVKPVLQGKTDQQFDEKIERNTLKQTAKERERAFDNAISGYADSDWTRDKTLTNKAWRVRSGEQKKCELFGDGANERGWYQSNSGKRAIKKDEKGVWVYLTASHSKELKKFFSAFVN